MTLYRLYPSCIVPVQISPVLDIAELHAAVRSVQVLFPPRRRT
jgi:hypothetical protein